MKFRSVQKLGKNSRNLLPDNAWAVVDYRYPKAGCLAWRRGISAVCRYLQFNNDFRQNAGFFTGIQRVIDGFFDTGEQRFSRIVETQKVTVLGKEFRDGDLAL